MTNGGRATDSTSAQRPADAGHTFLCHASENHAVAVTLCDALEASGVPCWIAPRDIPAGANYADSIVAAISQARSLLLVYSRHAELSAHVRRELEQAVNNDLRIIPVRIEDVEPSPEVGYYLGAWQWLDAFPPPIDDHVEGVVAAAKSREPAIPRRRRRSWRAGAVAAAVGLVVVALVAILAFQGGSEGDEAAQRVDACRSTHGLAKARTTRVLSESEDTYRAVFEACAWPPAPGAHGDGFTEITVTTDDGPGRDEAEGLTLRNVFTSECSELEVKYLFSSQGKLVAQKPLVLAKGSLVRVEDGSAWKPRTEDEEVIYTPSRDEFVVLSTRRYNVDSARCV